MTADVELLPLPELPRQVEGYSSDYWEASQVEEYATDYARACVAHATAAKDAEIEALRAEVERLTSMARMQAARADAAEREASHRKARAERLAEALREVKERMLSQVKWEACDCGCPQGRKPANAVSVTWLRAVQQVEIATARAEEKK